MFIYILYPHVHAYPNKFDLVQDDSERSTTKQMCWQMKLILMLSSREPKVHNDNKC